jgi:hypothetical protein
MCYCVETLANLEPTTLQMTRGHSSSGPDKQDRLTHHPSHDLNLKSRRTFDRSATEDAKPCKGATVKCLPKMSTSHITTHVLLRGDVSDLEADHPTNDPRPFFKWTRQTDRLTHHPSHDLNLQSLCTIYRFRQKRQSPAREPQLSAFPR